MLADNTNNKRSLINLVIGVVSFALCFLLAGNMVLNVVNTRSLLQDQLYSHAQDSATSLGLSLSTVVDASDDVLAGRMIDAIFDSGDYNRIIFFGTDRRAKVSRKLMNQNAGVPAWFVSLIDLDAPMATAQVMSGWKQLGELVVQSSTGNAYGKLWETAQNQLIWFSVVLLSALLAMKLLLNRLLAPLRQLEQQAHEVSVRNFDFQIAEPATRELHKVWDAMNEMSGSLEQMFAQQLEAIERLREQSLLDPLTGLHNREGFDRRLKAELESQQGVRQGTLILLKINEFEQVNQSIGRAQADELLVAFANILKPRLEGSDSGFAARRSGADFSLFLPDLIGDEVEVEASRLLAQLNSLVWVRQSLRDDLIHMGLACVSEAHDVGHLLSKADMALRAAQSNGISGWQRFSELDSDHLQEDVKAANNWHFLLKRAFESKTVSVFRQDVFQLGTRGILYQQALARITDGDELLSASIFIPMAKRFKLMSDLDQLVIESTFDHMQGSAEEWSVSISEQSLLNPGFSEWFVRSLAQRPDLASRLIIQVSEHTLKHAESELKQLCDATSVHGVRLVIERFGVSSLPFSYLKRLPVYAIKIDHSFIRNVHRNIENQFFLNAVVQLAGSQGVKVIAVGVESEAECNALTEIGVSGAMGYFLSKPVEA